MQQVKTVDQAKQLIHQTVLELWDRDGRRPCLYEVKQVLHDRGHQLMQTGGFDGSNVCRLELDQVVLRVWSLSERKWHLLPGD